jgi:hypothetical protein
VFFRDLQEKIPLLLEGVAEGRGSDVSVYAEGIAIHSHGVEKEFKI